MTAIHHLARWILLFCLIEAPWAYGSTRPWAIEFLNALLFLSLLLHLPGLISGRCRGRHPLLPLGCLALLVMEDFWMWLNARSYHDSTFWQFAPLTQLCPALPGSWDRATTGWHLESLIALSGGFLVVIDMVYEARWRQRLWLTMALTGLSVVLYGMIQHVFEAPSIFWLQEETGNTFFGPFRYHGNAGAFLNLIWPVFVFLLIKSFRRPQTYVQRALWASCLFLTLAGCVINISRVAAAIAILLLLVSIFWIVPRASVRSPDFHWGRWKVWFLVGLIVVFGCGLVIASRSSVSERHWVQLPSQLNEDNQRLLTYGACLRTIPEAGWFGYGAGTFSAIFPYHTLYLGDRIQGFWMYAHEDYLQTVVEYGYVGALLWSLFFLGAIYMGLVRSAQSKRAGEITGHVGYAVGVLALLAIALHSLVDFPLQVPSIQLYVFVWIALLWRNPAMTRDSAEAQLT